MPRPPATKSKSGGQGGARAPSRDPRPARYGAVGPEAQAAAMSAPVVEAPPGVSPPPAGGKDAAEKRARKPARPDKVAAASPALDVGWGAVSAQGGSSSASASAGVPAEASLAAVSASASASGAAGGVGYVLGRAASAAEAIVVRKDPSATEGSRQDPGHDMASEAADAAQKQPPTFGGPGAGSLGSASGRELGSVPVFRPHGGSSAVAAAPPQSSEPAMAADRAASPARAAVIAQDKTPTLKGGGGMTEREKRAIAAERRLALMPLDGNSR